MANLLDKKNIFEAPAFFGMPIFNLPMEWNNPYTWVFPKIGVQPKWMVYNGKPYSYGWFGDTPIFGITHMELNGAPTYNCFSWAHPLGAEPNDGLLQVSHTFGAWDFLQGPPGPRVRVPYKFSYFKGLLWICFDSWFFRWILDELIWNIPNLIWVFWYETNTNFSKYRVLECP